MRITSCTVWQFLDPRQLILRNRTLSIAAGSLVRGRWTQPGHKAPRHTRIRARDAVLRQRRALEGASRSGSPMPESATEPGGLKARRTGSRGMHIPAAGDAKTRCARPAMSNAGRVGYFFGDYQERQNVAVSGHTPMNSPGLEIEFVDLNGRPRRRLDLDQYKDGRPPYI